ncbi:hypothetical protein GDO81_003654 [Engystomops pustulosus]|uniref:Androgen receptor n=3 Tax=Engystomops pustulosus TaxID=76066 RepID=A0AAV6ZXM6_ENGPU|nr:hypothetical protein GDO81_003654 [Engystomops pustulosus]
MEVHIGLGGVYKQPPGKMIRGAFENLFLSVREALQGDRRAAAPPEPCHPLPVWREPAAPHSAWTEPPADWGEARGTQPAPWREGAPPDTAPPYPALSGCSPELKEILGEQGGMLDTEQGSPEQASKESRYPLTPEGISDSAKEICKAVSVSLGLSMEALEHLNAESQRGDCMFAGPSSSTHTMDTHKCQEEDKSGASSPQYREGAFRRSSHSNFSAGKAPEDGTSLGTDDKEQTCTELALPESGGYRSRGMELAPSLTLYKPSTFMEDNPAYPAYSFQMALTPHSRIKVESPMEFGGSAWGAPSRYSDISGYAHCGPAANWHSLFEEGQSAGSYTDASLYSYPRSHVAPGPDGEFPSDTWYPAPAMLGRVPYGSPMKSEMNPWMDGYPGAFGEMR